MNNTLGNIFGQQPAAPVGTAAPIAVTTSVAQPVAAQPVAAQPANPAFAQPAPVAQPVAAQPVAAQPVVAQPANNLGGGGRLAAVKNALMTAKVGSSRNDLPEGTGLYLLKEGKYTVTDRKSTRLTNYSMVCLKGIKDGLGQAYGAVGYVGPIPGEEYSTALFHDGDYAFNSLLKALSACFGWDKVMTASMQTPARIDQLIQLLDLFTGVSAETCQPTNQPCCFSNQVILEMTAQTKVSAVKVNGVQPNDPVTNLPMTKAYTNDYWNKRVPLAEAVAGLDPTFCIKAFGSQEAITAALETEKQLDAFA